MKTMKKQTIKRLLSISLILCMLVPLLPVTAFAAGNSGATHVRVDGKTLKRENLSLSDGTAVFDGAGVLTLNNYNGGVIGVNYLDTGAAKDLTIKLIGDNTITNETLKNQGVMNNTGGDINIIADDKGTLKFKVKNSSNHAYGILCETTGYAINDGAGVGNINIGGNANLVMNVEGGLTGGGKAYALSSEGKVTISDNASLKVDVSAQMAADGIYAKKEIEIDTSNDITIACNGNGDSRALNSTSAAPSKIDLKKVGILLLKTKNRIGNSSLTYPDEMSYEASNFLKTSFEDDGYFSERYQYAPNIQKNTTLKDISIAVGDGGGKLPWEFPFKFDPNTREYALKTTNKRMGLTMFKQAPNQTATATIDGKSLRITNNDESFSSDIFSTETASVIKITVKSHDGTTTGNYKITIMKPGWNKVSGAWYYMNSNGSLETGWNQVSNTWYYMNNSGAMQTGWVQSGGTWYYMSSSGAMQTGWVQSGNTWYYMSGSGAMQTGWVQSGGTWYYMSGSGAMQTGWTKVSGKWYYMSGSGAMQTGWTKVGGTWYYMNSSGAMQTGWVKLGGSWYYLKGSGAMQTGKANIAGKSYYFDSSGRMR